jgi:hypothetical protein
MQGLKDIKNKMKNHYNGLKSKNVPPALYDLVDDIVDAVLESAAANTLFLLKKNTELETKIKELEKER